MLTKGSDHLMIPNATQRLDRFRLEPLEIGSAFFCSQWGITDTARRLDHADYIAGWLQMMRADSRAILTAASKAQQAADFLNEAAGINTERQPTLSQPETSELQVAA